MKVLIAQSDAAPAELVRLVNAAVAAHDGAEVQRIDLGRMGQMGSRLGRVVKAIIGEAEAGRLVRELKSQAPDVALAFDPAAAAALVLARDRKVSATPVVAVVPDLSPRAAWAVDADRYTVLDDEAAVTLAERGVDGARIIVAGPIASHAIEEAARTPKRRLREELKLPADGAVVLVETRGMSQETLSQVTLQLALVGSRAATLFDAGDDAAAAALLRKQVPGLGLKAKLFGDTPHAARLWRAADVVVARPSLRVIHKALAAGCAFVALEPESAEEKAEAKALVERRLGLVVDRTLMLAALIEPLCAHARSGAIARAAARPSADGAGQIAELVAEVAAHREEILEETAAAAPPPAPEEEEEARREEPRGPASEVEELGGEDTAPWSTPAAETRDDLSAAEERARRELEESRAEAEKWEERKALAQKQGDAALAEKAAREADRKRARMHTALGELRRLAQERQRAPAAPQAPTLDDALSALKARARSAPGPRAPQTVDEELASLKRRMETDKRRKP